MKSLCHFKAQNAGLQTASESQANFASNKGPARDPDDNRVGTSAVSGTPTGKFPKSAHLLKHADFQRVYRQGRRHFSGNMTVFYLRAATVPEVQTHEVRIGFTVPRALGPSVERNRIRRRMREAVRRNLQLLADVAGVDVVFNPKRTAREAPFTTISEEVARAFEVVRKNLRDAFSKPASKLKADSL
jgi:ribonuclease P protein component